MHNSYNYLEFIKNCKQYFCAYIRVSCLNICAVKRLAGFLLFTFTEHEIKKKTNFIFCLINVSLVFYLFCSYFVFRFCCTYRKFAASRMFVVTRCMWECFVCVFFFVFVFSSLLWTQRPTQEKDITNIIIAQLLAVENRVKVFHFSAATFSPRKCFVHALNHWQSFDSHTLDAVGMAFVFVLVDWSVRGIGVHRQWASPLQPFFSITNRIQWHNRWWQ